MSRTVRAFAPALALGIALSLSGCSVASQAVSPAPAAASSAAAQANLPAAQDLWTAVKASMAAATSAHVKGNGTSGSSSLTIDIAGTRDGSNSKMIRTLGGAKGQVLTVGASQYVQGNAEFWKLAGVSSDVIASVGTKYVKTATSKDNGAVSVGDALDSMATASFSIVDMLNLKVEKTDFDGTAAYLVSERVPTPDQFTMWVSVDSAVNLLRLRTAGTSPVDLTFTEWNAVAPFTTPPADQVFAR